MLNNSRWVNRPSGDSMSVWRLIFVTYSSKIVKIRSIISMNKRLFVLVYPPKEVELTSSAPLLSDSYNLTENSVGLHS